MSDAHYGWRTIKISAIWILLITTAAAFRPCQPFGLRMFYGKTMQDPLSDQKIMIYFNTAAQCKDSYVQYISQQGLKRLVCQTKKLVLSEKMNNYKTYIHKCSLKDIQFEHQFLYNAYGIDRASSSDVIPFQNGYIESKIANPANKQRAISLVVTADWGPIKTKNNYIPIVEYVRAQISLQEINGILVLGDVGYDLDSNNGSNYEDFLVLISKSGANKVPFLLVTGNHEHNTQDDLVLYQESFVNYNLDTVFATGLQIGSIFLAAFDPFITMNKKKSNSNLQAVDPSLQSFRQVMKKAASSNRFIVPASHYPFVCSGSSPNCQGDQKDLKQFFNLMFENDVTLYLGAHYHTYQRAYPFFINGTFKAADQAYRTDQHYLVSIVQGVAGNDKAIVEEITKIQNFTAAHTQNETGFGVLTVTPNTAKYFHYSTKGGLHLADKVQINNIREAVTD